MFVLGIRYSNIFVCHLLLCPNDFLCLVQLHGCAMCVCWLQPSSSTLHCTERDVLERGVQRWADVNRDERWSIESARVCVKVEMRWDLDVSFEYAWVTEWNTRKRRINIEKISCRVHASSPMLRRRSDSQNGAVRVPDIIRIGQFLWKIWKKHFGYFLHGRAVYHQRLQCNPELNLSRSLRWVCI